MKTATYTGGKLLSSRRTITPRASVAWLTIGIAALAVIVWAAPVVRAADESGGQASAYLEWGVGARPVGMGGAFTAVASGPTGFWWNPAGVSQERERGFEAALRKMSFDRQAGYAVLLYPVGTEEAAVALSWVYAGVGDLFEVDLDGYRGDQISDFTNAVGFTFGRRFSPPHSRLAFSLGVTLRYVQHNIANISAYSIGFDVGAHARYQLRPAYYSEESAPPELCFGLAVQRLNQKFPWTTTDYWARQGEDAGSSFEDAFPVLVRFGVAATLMKQRLTPAIDIVVDEKQGATWHVGAEGRPHPLLALRAGLDDGDPAFGVGLRPKIRPGIELLFDYAFAVQPDVIDAEHIFSLGIRF